MQPFLSRASTSITRQSHSHRCYTPTINRNYTYQPGTVTKNAAAPLNCPLKLKFGEFYKRFYSAMSGAAVAEDGKAHDEPAKSAPAIAGMTRAYIRRKRRQRLAELLEKEREAAAVAAVAAEKREKRRELHQNNRFVPKERRLHLENSTVQLTTRFLEHDLLCREIRAKIKRRQSERERNYQHPDHPSPRPKESIPEEVDLLKRTLRYITTHYYEPPDSAPSTDPDPDPDPDPNPEPDPGPHTPGFKTSPVPWFTPYLPPFPNFTSPSSATPLNRSLIKLLKQRPPSPSLIPKLCYNLLTSPSPPTIITYNILIEGLTLIRQGSLAHIVFRNLVAGGLGPKGRPNEATIIRMLNLCVKTGDRSGFDRIVKITSARNMAVMWGRGATRAVKRRDQKRRGRRMFEAMISGAARFGDAAQVRIWVRAMRRECPENPEPGVVMLTSLMRMWAELKDWDRGLRCWRDLRRLDEAWMRDRSGELADLRAFRQMVKLCRECGKVTYGKRVVKIAVQRGWREKDVLRPVSKTKGLWVRRENKTPHIRGQRRQSRKEEQKLLTELKRLWELKNGGEVGQPVWRRSRVGEVERSKIWEDVIARRMDDVTPAQVGVVPAQEGVVRTEFNRDGKHRSHGERRAGRWEEV